MSKVVVSALVRGRGEASVAVYRHLAPLTVNALLRTLPLEGRVSSQPAMTAVFATLRVGVEKPRLAFERGDVAFLASGELLCFFTSPARSDRPLNPVGKVESGLEFLAAARPGDVVALSQPVQ